MKIIGMHQYAGSKTILKERGKRLITVVSKGKNIPRINKTITWKPKRGKQLYVYVKRQDSDDIAF